MSEYTATRKALDAYISEQIAEARADERREVVDVVDAALAERRKYIDRGGEAWRALDDFYDEFVRMMRDAKP